VLRPARLLLGVPARWVVGRWPLVLTSAILAYFAYHAVHGQRGLLAWVDRNREIEAARQELAGLTAEREAHERRIRGLRPGQLDRDLLEEELRQLGYVRPNEVIVLPSQPAAAATPAN
jgi:cell division protein FtsB